LKPFLETVVEVSLCLFSKQHKQGVNKLLSGEINYLEFSALAVVARRSIPGRTLETVERFNARRVVVVVVLRRPPLVVDLSARLMVDMLFALVRLDSPILGSGGPIFCFLSATPVSSSIDLGLIKNII